MDHSEPMDQRTMELLAGRVLGDMTQLEEAELRDLENSTPLRQFEFELERTAAAVQLALLNDSNIEPIPLALKQQIPTGSPKVTSAAQSPWNLREALAWVGCAACLFLAVMVWRSRNSVDDNSPKPIPALYAREEFIRNTKDKLLVQWSPGKHPFAEAVGGDVIWSNEQQQGYMRFVGMPINDPKVEQYQLWIIDPERDDEPIDGGVFDITSSGEEIVPIYAKLKVLRPAAFAITVEKPGGVVVSKQDRLPLLAAVK
jgi:Anti-sigma-K factor rskA